MKERCVVCGAARGKRVCSMEDRRLVCPGCCAEKRNEQQCGECSWYAGKDPRTLPEPGMSAAPEISSESEERVGKGLAFLATGELERAAQVLLVDSEPEDYLDAYGRGCLHGARAEHEKAVHYLRRSVEMFPEFMEAHYALGSECLQAMDLTGTIRAYRRVLDLGRPGEEFHDAAESFLTEMEEQLLADEGLSVDQYLDAVDSFERGFQALRARDFEGALPHLCHSLELSDSHAHPHGVCGLCHAFLGQKEEAHASLHKAVERDPDYASSLVYTMAREVLKGGKKGTAEAIRDLEQALNCPAESCAGQPGGE